MSPRAAIHRPQAGWDIGRIIAEFGGIPPLIEAHKAEGFEPLTVNQVSNWRLRGTAPGERLAEIFVTLKRSRNNLHWQDFVQKRAS